MNLFEITSAAITHLHPDTSCTLYRSIGQAVLIDGEITPFYDVGIRVLAQFQSLSANQLYHSDRVGREENTKKIYIKSQSEKALKVAGIVRELERNGDILVEDDGTTWLIDATLEDFSVSGWVVVRGILQSEPFNAA